MQPNFTGEVFKAEGRTCGDKPTRGRGAPWAKKKCSPDRGVSAKVWRAPLSQVLYLQGTLTLVLSSGQRDLAGLYPERLPIAPPPARLQSLVRRRRRTQGARQTLLRRRMWTGCLPPILGGECHVPQASSDNSSGRLFLPRGVRCLQLGRCVPTCHSKWSSQSHGAICKRHTCKKFLVIIYITVAPET